MTIAPVPTRPRRWSRLATGIVAATAGALIGVVATTGLDGQGATSQPVVRLSSSTSALPFSADAAEQWLSERLGVTGFECRPDAAARWQVPNIAVADLPFTADAAEQWLTPEINVADLPFSADAAEHWLCAP